jgi:hypothetical protein
MFREQGCHEPVPSTAAAAAAVAVAVAVGGRAGGGTVGWHDDMLGGKNTACTENEEDYLSKVWRSRFQNVQQRYEG